MKFRILAVAYLLNSCASVFRTVPPVDEYRYQDSRGNIYHFALKKGQIAGLSTLVDSKGDTIEALLWTHQKVVLRRQNWKRLQYFGRDTLVANSQVRESVERCRSSKNNEVRKMEDYQDIIDEHWPDMVSVYDRYLKIHRFGGRLRFSFSVDPNGNLDNIYLTDNTSGDHDFALSILDLAKKWKFKAIDSDCVEKVEQAFDFRP